MDVPQGESPIVTSVALIEKTGVIERRMPKEAVEALEMMCNGVTYRNIELKTGIKFDTLMALRSRHKVAVEIRREQLAADGFEMAEGLRLLAQQKMSDLAADPKELKKVNLRDLAISYGVAVDKGMLALDGNRVTVEHVSKKPSLADAMEAIKEARQALQKEAIPI